MPSASSAGMSVMGSALGAPFQAAQAVSLPAAQEFSLLILLCHFLQVAFSQHALNSVHRRSALVPGGPPLCLCIGASKAPTWPFSGWGGWPAIPGPQCWGRTSGTGLLCMRTTAPCSSARAAPGIWEERDCPWTPLEPPHLCPCLLGPQPRPPLYCCSLSTSSAESASSARLPSIF